MSAVIRRWFFNTIIHLSSTKVILVKSPGSLDEGYNILLPSKPSTSKNPHLVSNIPSTIFIFFYIPFVRKNLWIPIIWTTNCMNHLFLNAPTRETVYQTKTYRNKPSNVSQRRKSSLYFFVKKYSSIMPTKTPSGNNRQLDIKADDQIKENSEEGRVRKMLSELIRLLPMASYIMIMIRLNSVNF